MQKEIPALSTISPVKEVITGIIVAHLSARRAAVKDDNTTKYLSLGPVSGHIGKPVRILINGHIGAVIKGSGRKVLAWFHRFAWAVSPFFVKTMLMHSIIELEQINCNLVARHCQKFNESQLKQPCV